VFKLSNLPKEWDAIRSNFSWDIGVDLGSSNTLIYLRDRGVVIDEPTMVSRIKKKRWTGLSAPKSSQLRPIAYGLKAKEMLNRETQQIEVVSPIHNGIIYDLEATEALIGYYLKLIYEIPSKFPRVLKPRVIVGVTSRITEVQRRAIKSIFLQAGASEVVMVSEVVLIALSLGMPMERSSGLMIVDIGGGKTEAVVVSMGGVVVGRWIKTAGNDFDEAIINYVKLKYGLLIGQRSAERVKIEVGLGKNNDEVALLRGRDLETGLPKSIKVRRAEIEEAVALEVNKIVKLVSEVLDETPPELMEDIIRKGIVLTGNGAKFGEIDRMIEKETKINTRLANDSGLEVVKGAGMLIEDPSLLKSIRVINGN
jgi:rod shape-determining protein MreB